MKKLLFVIFIILCLNLTGCSNNTKATEQTDIEINLPKDNTVNGYRTKEVETEEYSDIVSADKVAVATGNESYTLQKKYCANKNSKVFHKYDCVYAKKLKKENKTLSDDRNALVKEGYSPCKQCEP